MIERYDRSVHEADVLRLGKMMQMESGYGEFVFDGGRLLGFLERSDVYCALARVGGEIIGGIVGCIAPHFFTTTLMAKDMALYIDPAHRGGSSAVRLVRGFEQWAKELGAKEVMLGQSTGIEIEKTRRWFEAIGYTVCGFTTRRAV